MNYVIDVCKNSKQKIDEIILTVQINNEEALAFYKKFGLTIIETKKNYYKRVEPRDAYLLSKKME